MEIKSKQFVKIYLKEAIYPKPGNYVVYPTLEVLQRVSFMHFYS